MSYIRTGNIALFVPSLHSEKLGNEAISEYSTLSASKDFPEPDNHGATHQYLIRIFH